MNTDLTQWLEDVTHDLPEAIVDEVRDELEAHYLDAYDYYLLSGLSIPEAQHAAFADLGDAQLTAAALFRTHQPERYYSHAAFASIAAPLYVLLVIFPLAVAAPPGSNGIASFTTYILINLMMGAASVWGVSHALKALSTLVDFRADLALPLNIIQRGMLAGLGLMLVNMLMSLGGAPDFQLYMLNDPLVVITTVERMEAVGLGYRIYASLMGGIVGMIGVGWLLLAIRLDGDNFHGLLRAIRFLCVISGLGLLGLAVGAMEYSYGICTMMTSFVSITALVKAAVLTLLFFRVAYRPRPCRFN